MKLNKLRGKRVENNLSQAQIADKLGISTGSYSRKENGVREFSRTEIKEISKVLGLSDEEIVEIFLLNS